MGKSPAHTDRTSMSRSPITELGTHTPVMVTAAKAASLSALRRAAATTPAGMAMSTETTVADSASWSETGTRSSRSRATARARRGKESSEPLHVLLLHGKIEPQARLDLAHLLGRRVGPRDEQHEIAGDEPHEHEH